MRQAVTMHLMPGPVGALGGGMLVTGIEDRCDVGDDGTPLLRVYLHARWKGIHVLLGDEAADEMRRAWGATFSTHLFVRFMPDVVPRFQTPEGARRTANDG